MPIQIALDSLKQAASGTANSATFLRGDNTFVAASVAANSAIASPVFSGTATGTYTLAGTPTITNPTLTLQSENVSPFIGFRNRVINGAMVIDQRNAGAAVTISSTNVYTVDRWASTESSDATFTVQQDSSAPTGFINSAKITVTVADASVAASQYNTFSQRIEGLNCADLAWGTASAATVTLSFWVRSSVTGTFGGALDNSAYNRSYPFTYTISAADTWEQKSVTIAGDTSGTWLTTNGIGITVYFDLGSGVDNTGTANAWVGAGNVGADSTVQLVNTLNATWYITGVQLEVGSTATPFERRPYGTELALCQRYYTKFGPASNFLSYDHYNTTSASCVLHLSLPVAMRATPTGSYSAIGDFGFFNTNSGNFGATGRSTTTVSVGTDASASARCQWYTNNSNAFVAFSIEL